MTDIGAPPSSPPAQTGPKPAATQPVTPAANASRDGGQQAAPQAAATAPTASHQGPAETPAVRLSEGAGAAAGGNEIRAIVIGRSAEGQALIQSPAGTFRLGSKLALRLNSELLLRVSSGGANLRATLMTVNGLPQRPPPEIALLSARAAATAKPATGTSPGPASLAAHLARPLFAGLGTGPAPPGATVASLMPGTLLSAVVVARSGPSLGQAATPGGAAPGLQLTAATPLVLRLAGLQAPTTSGGAAAANPGGASPTGPSGQTAPAAAPTPTPALTAGPLSRPVAALLGGPKIEGVVTGTTGDGALLVRTPIGNLALDARVALALGTRLSFEVWPQRPPTTLAPALASALAEGGRRAAPQGTTGATATPAATSGSLAAGAPAGDVVRQFANAWPALREALSVIQAADAGVAQHIVNNVMPSATPQLASAMLFFLAALRGGEVRNWLGRDGANLLERMGRGDLLNRLAADLGQLGRAAETPLGGDWRGFVFPFFDGYEVQQLWAFLRQRGSRDPEEKPGQRFVVEFELSALGRLQFDGLVQQKRFDLIVRSHSELPDAMRADIAEIFTSGIEVTGFEGALIFQSGGPFPVSPLREAQHREGGEMVA